MTEDHNQVIDEGIIKFSMQWQQESLTPTSGLTELIKYRNILRENNFIGAYAQDIGFGNVSIRTSDSQQFYISGSQTGHIKIADKSHMSLVTQCSVEKNSLTCKGEVKASSESLTHFMFYELDPSIQAVVHIHHRKLWEKYKFDLPTTAEDVPYGTTAMALEIKRLFLEEDLQEKKILVMAGHEEGMISFGPNLEQASSLLLNL